MYAFESGTALLSLNACLLVSRRMQHAERGNNVKVSGQALQVWAKSGAFGFRPKASLHNPTQQEHSTRRMRLSEHCLYSASLSVLVGPVRVTTNKRKRVGLREGPTIEV